MLAVFSIFISIVIFALGLIHIYWGHGGNWPGNNRQDLIDKVFGEGTQFPSTHACYAVAVVLILAGVVPLCNEGVLFSAEFNSISWLNSGFCAQAILNGHHAFRSHGSLNATSAVINLTYLTQIH